MHHLATRSQRLTQPPLHLQGDETSPLLAHRTFRLKLPRFREQPAAGFEVVRMAQPSC